MTKLMIVAFSRGLFEYILDGSKVTWLEFMMNQGRK